MSPSIIERVEVTPIGTVAVEHPSPTIYYHFKFDVSGEHGARPPRRRARGKLVGAKVRDSDDAAMPVNYPTRVHLRENCDID